MIGHTTKCERCDKPSNIHIMSMFNRQTICNKCKDEERAHPLYEEAREADIQAVIEGNYNFPGIGWPDDKTRRAVVHSTSEAIAAYLPSGYKVTKVENNQTHIEGKDRAGWTLDGYVIPRLASGMFRCEEVK